MMLEEIYFIAGICTLGVVLINSLMSFFTLRYMKKQQEEEVRPYVVFYVNRSDLNSSFINLCIENLGKSIAYNIKVDKEINYFVGAMKNKFKNTIKNLAPNQKIETLATPHDNIISGLISYEDNKGKRYKSSFELDFSVYIDTMVIRSPLEDIARNTKNISDKIS